MMLNYQIYKNQKVIVLVDVQNMYYSAKNLYNSKVNFEKIMETALKGRNLTRAIAYAIKADVKDENNFHDALEKVGLEVKAKDLLVFHGGHKKGDWDVGIAMDAVRAADKVDVVVVVSGDGDFKDMYEYVRGKGCRIEVIAFGRTASSSIKDYVDEFEDMDLDKKKYLIPLKPYSNNSKSSSGNKSKQSNKKSSGESKKSSSQKSSQKTNSSAGGPPNLNKNNRESISHPGTSNNSGQNNKKNQQQKSSSGKKSTSSSKALGKPSSKENSSNKQKSSKNMDKNESFIKSGDDDLHDQYSGKEKKPKGLLGKLLKKQE